MAVFESTKEQLQKLLERVDAGEIQLPDFQRGWVWPEDSMRSLLASVLNGFPVGSLLTLQTGGDLHFEPRVLEGAPSHGAEPDELLLDGQQRMTTLYQTLFSCRVVDVKNQRKGRTKRFFYLDIVRALEEDTITENAIVAVPEDRIVRTNFDRDIKLDLSSREKEFAHHHFPLNLSFDSTDWYHDWRDYWDTQENDIRDLERGFDRDLLQRIKQYEMPFIRLSKRSSRKAVCVVFEKVNTGGKKLDAFELLTAIYAADKFDLRKDWLGDKETGTPGRKTRLLKVSSEKGVLAHVESTDFLQACTVLSSMARRQQAEAEGKVGRELPFISCRHEDILDLNYADYQHYADDVERGFKDACRLLATLKIMRKREVPYPPQLVTLAAAYAALGRDAHTKPAADKLERWFWSTALGEYYGSTSEGKIARDVPELIRWIQGASQHPRSLDECVFQEDRLDSLYTRGSAAYKSVNALLLRHECRDFVTGRAAEVMTYYQEPIDIHHIFPTNWCSKHHAENYNSIVNKTPLFGGSNRSIGGAAPSVYLKRLEERNGMSPDELDELLRTHLIEPRHLRDDDYDAFYQARKRALAELISSAMYRDVALEPLTDPVGDEHEDEDEPVAAESEDLEAQA